MRTYHRWIGTMALIASVGRLSLAAGAEPNARPSSPPDTTPYVRPLVPEEGAPPYRLCPPRAPAPAAPTRPERRRHGARPKTSTPHKENDPCSLS
jgi:hypothetical protein